MVLKIRGRAYVIHLNQLKITTSGLNVQFILNIFYDAYSKITFNRPNVFLV